MDALICQVTCQAANRNLSVVLATSEEEHGVLHVAS